MRPRRLASFAALTVMLVAASLQGACARDKRAPEAPTVGAETGSSAATDTSASAGGQLPSVSGEGVLADDMFAQDPTQGGAAATNVSDPLNGQIPPGGSGVQPAVPGNAGVPTLPGSSSIPGASSLPGMLSGLGGSGASAGGLNPQSLMSMMGPLLSGGGGASGGGALMSMMPMMLQLMGG